MKFKCCNLYRALNTLSSISDRNSLLNKNLSNSYLLIDNNKLIVYASDSISEIFYETNIDIFENNNHTYDGSKIYINVNLSKLYHIFRSFDNDVVFVFDYLKDKLKVTVSNSVFNINCISNQMREEHQINNYIEHSFIINSKVLYNLLNDALFIIDEDNSRQYMTCMMLKYHGESLKVTATNGHILASIENKCKLSKNVQFDLLLPYLLIQNLMKIISETKSDIINIYTDDNKNLYAYIGNYSVNSRLLEYNYPKYEHLLDDVYTIKFKFKKEEFKKTITRMIIIIDDRYPVVVFKITSNKILLEATNMNNDSVIEEINATSSINEEIKFGVNANYMLSIINVLQSEEIEFLIRQDKKIMLFKNIVDDKYNCYQKYLLMPVNI